MFPDEAGEERAEDAADRKGAVEETVHLRSSALFAKDPRSLHFLFVDSFSDLGESRGDDERNSKADEAEKRAQEHFLFQTRVVDQVEKRVERYRRNKTTGGQITRTIFVREVAYMMLAK